MTENSHAIKVSDLSKRYRIGVEEKKYDNFFAAAFHLIRSPFRNFKKYRSLYKFKSTTGEVAFQDDLSDGIIWALRGVSFNVERGEVLGIIGKNGAGKSTLLKILSRITHPTGGRIEAFGKVSSLLEVGTGFHPELTGRENVYLNGTILGMRKKEIDHKFKDIVKFSEVGKFIDTPVKRYSSGMKVRLAFSVAAHIEPEVLIIDEVLAVGDASFRKKCYAKMEEIGNKGKTVLFVSHDMQAIQRLCTRVILVDAGSIKADGPAAKVVGEYLNTEIGVTPCREWDSPDEAPGGDVARLRAVRVRSREGNIIDAEDIVNPVRIEMEFEVLKSGFVLLPNFHFYDNAGTEVISVVDLDPEWRKRPRPEGTYVTTAEIPGNLLTEGLYFVRSCLITLDPFIPQYNIPYSVAFSIIDNFSDNSSRGDYVGKLPGIIRPYLSWSTKFLENNHTES